MKYLVINNLEHNAVLLLLAALGCSNLASTQDDKGTGGSNGGSMDNCTAASCQFDTGGSENDTTEHQTCTQLEPSELSTWVAVQANPLIALPSCPAWNCLGTSDPALAQHPDGSIHIWYVAGGDGNGPVLGHMVAPDARSPFTAQPDAPINASGPENRWDLYRETPSVLWDAEREEWHMWYLGYRISPFEDPGIGHAFSRDPRGVLWEFDQAPIYRPRAGSWDSAFITGPSALKKSSGEYAVYYSGAGTTIGIGLLTSPDGKTWSESEHNPVFERDLGSWDQGIIEPFVFNDSSSYWLFYSGYAEPLDVTTSEISIGLARSNNGLSFSRFGAEPVLNPGPQGTWWDLKVPSPSVIRLDDCTLLMAAYGGSLDTKELVPFGQIGLWRTPSSQTAELAAGLE